MNDTLHMRAYEMASEGLINADFMDPTQPSHFFTLLLLPFSLVTSRRGKVRGCVLQQSISFFISATLCFSCDIALASSLPALGTPCGKL